MESMENETKEEKNAAVPAVGDVVELEIADVAYRGNGIARVGGVVVFVPGTLPGEKILARSVAFKKRYFEAEIVRILTPSPDRIVPCCVLPDGSPVPGCAYDYADYAAEVALKDAQLRNFLRKFVTDADSIFLPSFASPSPLHYRNKVVFHVQRTGAEEARIGYLGSDNETVVDVESCPLADPAINFAWARLRTNAKRKLNDGDSITLRHTKTDSVVSWVNRAPDDAAWLTEETQAGLLTVPTDGFFQVNPGVADALVSQVREWVRTAAAESGAGTLLDLYCGVGVFGLTAAKDGMSAIVGIESGRNAVTAARRNARANGVTGAKFYCETAAVAAAKNFHCTDFGDVIAVVDPPRAGMETAAVKALAKAGPRTVVYVSCDPATLSRDLAVFTANGYVLRKARMFDMFPRTVHFETVCLLSRSVK